MTALPGLKNGSLEPLSMWVFVGPLIVVPPSQIAIGLRAQGKHRYDVYNRAQYGTASGFDD